MSKQVSVDLESLKKLVAAAECAQALDMKYHHGLALLEHHGFSNEDRFDLPASEFVKRKLDDALSFSGHSGVLDAIKEADNA